MKPIACNECNGNGPIGGHNWTCRYVHNLVTRKDTNVTAINLKHGDKVTLNWRLSCERTTAEVVDYKEGLVILVYDGGASALTYSTDGRQVLFDGSLAKEVDVTPIDTVREQWDALEPYVREMLSWIAKGERGTEWYAAIPGQKVKAIKFLREAVPGMSFADAKRAIEQFA